MADASRHLTFEPIAGQGTGFRRLIWISVAAHLALFIAIPLISHFQNRTTKMHKAYLFDMVDAKPFVRRFPVTAQRPVPPKETPKKAAPAPKVKPAEKALVSKKEEPKKEEVKEPPKEEPVQNPFEQTTDETAKPDPAAETGSQESEISVGGTNFPYAFYLNQVKNAVLSTWRNLPQELLGSEAQLTVTVKFKIMKDGAVSGISIEESSWNSIADKFAIRAIEKARIPPIPGSDPELSITFKLVAHRDE